jgi:acetyl esterase/lipase
MTKGKCIGLSGDKMPKIVLSGDSAGGNLATSMLIKLLQVFFPDIYNDTYRRNTPQIPLPEALILIYPALEMNVRSFMRPEDVELLIQPEYRKQNKKFIKRKSEAFRRLTPKTPHGSDDEDDTPRASTPNIDTPRENNRSQVLDNRVLAESPVATDATLSVPNGTMESDVQMQPRKLRTNIKMSSIISQLNDRVLPPELLRSMILLYIGEQHKPDLTSDHLLSPLLAPESILQRFPKVYMMCGEQDPLADDTFIFSRDTTPNSTKRSTSRP